MNTITKLERVSINKQLIKEGKRSCSSCNRIRSIDKFYVNPDKRLSSGYYLSTNCKKCEDTRTKQSYRVNSLLKLI